MRQSRSVLELSAEDFDGCELLVVDRQSRKDHNPEVLRHHMCLIPRKITQRPFIAKSTTGSLGVRNLFISASSTVGACVHSYILKHIAILLNKQLEHSTTFLFFST